MTELDRVLATRLQASQFVLERLQKLSDDVTSARKGLDDLSDEVYRLGASLQSVNQRALQLSAALEQWESDMTMYETTRNDFYLLKVDSIRTQHASAVALVTELRELAKGVSVNASRAITRLRRWSALSNPTVKIDDTTRDMLEEELRAAATESDPWKYYRDTVRDACDDLFSQYVDLLGGIALRDQGLDHVSRYADALVSLLLASFGEAGALAVPSRHTGQPLVQSHHIRLPLPPGWTLWSLPLVARGVGELLRSSRFKNATDADLVSDVFGTFVLGPAYAYAALLLELEPGNENDQRRAGAVLRMLRHMDEGDDRSRFTKVGQDLTKEWGRATAAAGADHPAATAESVPATDGVYVQVKKACVDAAYLARVQWDSVETLSADLRGSADRLEPRGELRDVLNAMWLARWEHPHDLSRIESRATVSAEQVMKGGLRSADPSAASSSQENK